MNAKINLLYVPYSAFMFILIVLLLKSILHIDVVPQTVPEFVIYIYNTGLMDSIDESMQDLEDTYTKISTCLVDTSSSKEEIIHLYNEVTNAPVCSIANRHFNSLADCFNSYEQQLSEIQEAISLYEENYNKCLDLISNIPSFSTLRDKKYNEFIDRFDVQYEFICQKKQNYHEDREELFSLYVDAKQIADDLFNEYYTLMCHIVYAEAGICPFTERCYVANVVENRIASNRYPNTIYGVVYDSGQYEPVMTGSINNQPSQSVKRDMQLYLRGHVETGMPSNIVYQALFRQGSGTWKHMPSGHYFCY